MDNTQISLLVLIIIVSLILVYGFRGGQFLHDFVLTRTMSVVLTRNTMGSGPRNMVARGGGSGGYMGRPQTSSGGSA